MNLSATRNRIIRINLMVTVAAFALTACIVPASFFGMNINHGVEVRAQLLTFPCNFCALHNTGRAATRESEKAHAGRPCSPLFPAVPPVSCAPATEEWLVSMQKWA